MRIIDCHTHCFTDDLAPRAVGRLVSSYNVVPSFDGTVGDLIRQMDDAGIEASVVVPVATKASQVKPINDWVLGIRHPRVIPFGAAHPEYPELREEMARLKAAGIKGVKLHPNWQGYKPEDPVAFPMYEAIIENDLIAFFHGGDELEKWPTPIASTPKALAEVNDRFPRMKLYIAHLGGYRMWDEVEEYLLGRDIYMDMSCCFPEDLPDDRYLRMMREHGIEKIVYASDSPCGPPVPQLRRLLALPMTEHEKSLVCWENAARLLGL